MDDSLVYKVGGLSEAGVEIHRPASLVEDDVVAPMEVAKVEGQRCWRLKGQTCCFGQGELAGEGGEGGINVAEAVEEDEDVC